MFIRYLRGRLYKAQSCLRGKNGGVGITGRNRRKLAPLNYGKLEAHWGTENEMEGDYQTDERIVPTIILCKVHLGRQGS